MNTRVAAIAALVASAGFVMGSLTFARAGTSPEEDGVTLLSPARTITGGTAVASMKAYSFVARGGSTTVPVDARRIRLLITAKGTRDGRLRAYGDPNEVNTAEELTWTANGSVSGYVTTGISDVGKVGITNYSSASATITVKIVGYSEQFRAEDISPIGGFADGVVRNGGTSATWDRQSPRMVVRENVITDAGSDSRFTGTADCHAGEHPAAGGVLIWGETGYGEVRTSAPTEHGWRTEIDFASVDAPRKVTVQVTCAEN